MFQRVLTCRCVLKNTSSTCLTFTFESSVTVSTVFQLSSQHRQSDFAMKSNFLKIVLSRLPAIPSSPLIPGYEDSRTRALENSITRGLEHSSTRGLEHSRTRALEDSSTRELQQSRPRSLEFMTNLIKCRLNFLCRR